MNANITRLLGARFLAVLAAFALLHVVVGPSQADDEAKADDKESIMAGYLMVPNEKVPQEYGGGFSLFVKAWPLLENYPGRKFQTGLFGTWMFPVYDPPVQRPLREGVYTDIEGGLGWWRDTRFATPTPKFIMGGVALNFVEWANGPGAGKGRDWEKPRGKYAVIQISPHVLWPPDGLNLKQGTVNEWFGYGYLPLPLTEPKLRTAGKDYPTGNQCWTLFLSTDNFKGPVAFFNPEFWTRHTVEKDGLVGKMLDSAPANPNRALQMETQYIPSVQAKDSKGVAYARIAPTRFPKPTDGVSTVVRQITSYKKSALWNDVEAWFAGGAVASGGVSVDQSQVHTFTGGGGASWALFIEGDSRKDRIPIDWQSFATTTKVGDDVFGYRWDDGLVRDVGDAAESLLTLPQYYRLETGGDRQRWVPIASKKVPKETELHDARFEAFKRPKTDPYTTPDEAASVWADPGPAAGPFTVDLGDGSRVTYGWYRFCDQPAVRAADWSETERLEMQRRIELIHRDWSSDRDYLQPPREGTLAALDPAVLVTPPKGLEVGYIPIVLRQETTP
ncbi:hypothetical protein Poly51_45500 [Rubripirellula tenax]|uniref:Uncharacterized protein n=1 Tax=Rubripirellula tenax TaxID=2528015 RepID=A0A5C6EMW0_9BACT|nr:hypothetical protein [Rubripirellula tenax]TWU48649.1 hypothetical protein Poly51_45500 [Rubripirellula tenax]